MTVVLARRSTSDMRHLLGIGALVMVGAALMSAAPSGSTVTGFEGLDRLYFERQVGDSPSPGWKAVRPLLPDRLSPPPRSGRVLDDGSVVTVRDLVIPGVPALVLREVSDSTHPRMPTTYWALYAAARRVDLWAFTPDPTRTDGKMLAPYSVQRIEEVAPDHLVLVTCGGMARPGGAVWEQGNDIHLVRAGDKLRFDRIVTNFFLARGYGQPSLSASRETEQRDGSIVVRELGAVAPVALAACRLSDDSDEWPARCADLGRAVHCLTDRPEATTRRRARGEPSFVERGWRAAPSTGP